MRELTLLLFPTRRPPDISSSSPFRPFRLAISSAHTIMIGTKTSPTTRCWFLTNSSGITASFPVCHPIQIHSNKHSPSTDSIIRIPQLYINYKLRAVYVLRVLSVIIVKIGYRTDLLHRILFSNWPFLAFLEASPVCHSGYYIGDKKAEQTTSQYGWR